ncbi:SRPBCC family protein [Sinorhizobium sp. 8-89]|uniref:SRPBCC family protein n=1 Tax=Sinorhizobium sp. 7-81 TaxID=3049087 RepID=UPI0024C24ACF|nr:SRPBCC family protein [Sinorhizobium sp. 7-81]MDK1384109.1 SRPBCC family protein [Sinorhizobium sp. 7-81]
MTGTTDIKPTDDRELVLTRLIDAPREKVYRAWTEADLLKQWFAPLPWTTPNAELDVRPGGSNRIVMRSPEGQDFPNFGVYLEVVPNEKLVVTDAFTEAWKPSEKPFMTVILTFEDEGGKTRYTARVRHWTTADREAHEKMGFHQGWGQCADQLATLTAKL